MPTTKAPLNPTVYRPEFCGTMSGWNRHNRRREIRCMPCTLANRVHNRAARAKRRIPREDRTDPTTDPKCGTSTGYTRHHARGEHGCADCKAAIAATRHQYYWQGGGRETQARWRNTATARRVNREGLRHKRHLAKLAQLTAPRGRIHARVWAVVWPAVRRMFVR